jgi:hypothetical protein
MKVQQAAPACGQQATAPGTGHDAASVYQDGNRSGPDCQTLALQALDHARAALENGCSISAWRWSVWATLYLDELSDGAGLGG